MKSFDTTSLRDSQSLEVLREVDAACTSFERALRRGELQRVEEIVAGVHPDARQPLLRELLVLEMEYRLKNGETPTLEQYRRRFPDDLALVKYLYFEHFVPAQLADFSIQRLLGRGAYGHVYQGWDAKLTRNVAIKVFRHDPMDPAPRGGSLRAEARAVAQLRHPGIVTVYAVQQDDDGAEFLVLEFVDGKSLEELLRSARPAAAEATRILLDVVRALQHAHQHGLVHRDLKPANIMLDAAQRPRVTDFGLALHLATGGRRPEIAGTLSYMAPEQASGETHRLDARTDLWAIGVILYRLLSGKLPFTGSNQQELLEAIRYTEPADLRAIDPQISPELARIVRLCLAKRMSDRYQSAAELADDLGAFANAKSEKALGEAAVVDAPIAVEPKGLRCFDADDRDFFLSLVPGTRDRHGVPSVIHFWERRLKELDAHETFRVGLLYGPSGCGKSSMIRAGILPRLPQNIKVVVVEGARDETELALIRELRRRFPGLSPEMSLPETLCELREGAWLAPGEKLLLVFDQFEQWLHGWRQDAAAQLVETLRQCDGGRVQALILVRDDFWMPATRFFQQLDAPLVEGFNASPVDLFDRAHASKVLAAFGVAYGRLDDKSWRQNTDQQRFLERAVDELAEGGRIVPVRLCIFAEMVKSRPWTTATLHDVGGAQGLGAAFLAEVFDGRWASPMYRVHRQAARLVLERLLPPPGTDIRGHLSPESELQAVSGYQERPADFAALLRCLDHELRLITPSDTEGAGDQDSPVSTRAAQLATGQTTPRLYQLTHDFLVTAIRSWLNQSRRQTVQGRAELRLAEYSDVYAARPETRQLPSWWEWLRFLILTREGRWRPAERTMMRRASRYHALRGALAVAAALLVGFIVYDRIASVRADGLVEALATSESRDVPQAAERLTGYRRLTRSRLIQRLEAQPQLSDQRTRLLLGLLAVGEEDTSELADRLLDSDPPLTVAITEVLSRNGKLADLEPRLWKVATDDQQPPAARLRASAALASLEPEARDDKWTAVAPTVVVLLLRDIGENPGFFNVWVDALSPTKQWLWKPLNDAFSDAARTANERVLAANILARYTKDDVGALVDLALESTPKQFEVFSRTLGTRASLSRDELLKIAKTSIPAELKEEKKDQLARRQTNAILLLRELGEEQSLWNQLKHSPDPRVRSFLINHLGQALERPDELMGKLGQEKDPGVLQAIILSLGSAAKTSLAISQSPALVNALADLYRNHPDPGVHGAAEWALRQLSANAKLDKIRGELAGRELRGGDRWYVTKSQITMIVVKPPGKARLGSPETEPGRDTRDEAVWTANVDWSFAISAYEITQAQYHALCPEYKEYLNEHAPDPSCPANVVTWREANEFCRRLSEQDGLPVSEIPASETQDPRATKQQRLLASTMYRLPLEVEWEVACRGGTETPRFFGWAPDLLSDYCCYIGNSGGRVWTVGRGLPSSLGLFDMLGNASEWCADVYIENRNMQDLGANSATFALNSNYTVRGNDHVSIPRMLRSANRAFSRADQAAFGRGFRIAQTAQVGESDK